MQLADAVHLAEHVWPGLERPEPVPHVVHNRPGFGRDGVEEEPTDATIAARALDISGGAHHQVMGQRIQLVDALSGTLDDIAAALGAGSFADAAGAPRAEIDAARDDVRNALTIAYNLYQATAWIYGPRSFGLRLASWVAAKGGAQPKSFAVLAWVLLRRSGADLWPSGTIAETANLSARNAAPFLTLRHLWKTDRRLRKTLDPKRLRRAFSGEIPWPPVLAEIESKIRECYG